MKIVSIGSFIDYQIQLANELSKKEKVMLIVYSLTDIPKEHYVNIDRNIEFVPIKNSKKLYNPKFLLNCIYILYKIYKFNPDIVHIQYGSEILSVFSSLLFKYPVVTTCHDVKTHKGEEKFFNRYLARNIVNNSKQIMVHGESLKKLLVSEYGIIPEKVDAIPIGSHNVEPFKIYEDNNIKEEPRTILFFGRIFEYKGLEYLIKAEPLITGQYPGAKIIIAGVGENFEKYEKMMANKDRFEVYNHYISYEQGAQLFQRCSVVVLPYIEASQSGVVSSAYCFKKPVIITNVGALPEIVDEGTTGIIIPPKNYNAIASAVIKLFSDDASRKEMGENAYKKLTTDMSWGNIVKKTITVYEKAIDNKK